MDNDIFKRFELNPKMKYFISLYFNQAKLYKRSSQDFSIFNLHTSINLIIEELSKNNNNRNLKFLQDKMQEIRKKDTLIKKHFEYKTLEIINNLTSNKEYALIVARSLLLDIDNGIYGKMICDRLIELLFNNNELEKEINEIHYLTEALLNEYIVYGYDDKSLDNILNNAFSGYIEYESHITTNYPIPKEIAGAEIKKYIEELTIKDRLEALKNCFDKEAKIFYCLFNISGVCGTDLDIHLNTVDIYNWKNSPKFDVEASEEASKMCPQYEHGDYKNNDVHCSVCIETIDINGLLKKVRQQVDSALDILYTHHNFGCKILVDYSEYIVFDEKKNIVLEGFTREYDEDFQRKVRPLSYNLVNDIKELNKKYQNYSVFILNKKDFSCEIIKNSVRYYRKGKEATRIEEKLLNYWICIENMFKIGIELPNTVLDKNCDDLKLDTIISLVPYINLQVSIINKLWMIHDYYFDGYLQKRFVIEKEQADALQLIIGEINLVDFVNNFEILETKLSTDFEKKYYQKITSVLTSTDYLKQIIDDYITKTKNTLLLSYRYRNMIVHNAQFDITYMDYYVQQLDVIIIRLLSVITNEIYSNETSRNLDSIILSKYIEQKQLKKDLEAITLKEWLNLYNK